MYYLCINKQTNKQPRKAAQILKKMQKQTPLTTSTIANVIGKIIQWNAESYNTNHPYSGTAIIHGTVEDARRPGHIRLLGESLSGDNINYGFMDGHGLKQEGNDEAGNPIYVSTDENQAFSYSDSYREIFFTILKDNWKISEVSTNTLLIY